MAKLITTFPKIVSELVTFSRGVKVNLSASMDYQQKSAEFESEVAKLSELIDRLVVADEAARTKDITKVAYRDKVRDELIAQLLRVAKHVELTAGGDVATLRSSGFLVYEAKNHRAGNHHDIGFPLPVLSHGKLPGTMVVKAKSVRGSRMYELQLTDKDPSVEANYWVHGLHPSSRIDVGGLISGINYWARMRCYGTSGAGAWSPPVSLRML